jgi:hypothetical protein
VSWQWPPASHDDDPCCGDGQAWQLFDAKQPVDGVLPTQTPPHTCSVTPHEELELVVVVVVVVVVVAPPPEPAPPALVVVAPPTPAPPALVVAAPPSPEPP